MQRRPPRPHRDQRLDGLDDRRRDVLQLVGDDGAPLGQPERRTDVVVGADDELVGDGGAGAVDVGVEDRDAVAHRPGRLGEHPAQLAAAEDADRGGRQDGRRDGLADGGRHAPRVYGPGSRARRPALRRTG